MTPAEILIKYWGFDSFRPVQEEVIKSVLSGRDTLAILPTGGGKSLCFQVPSLMREGLCLVVSPLIALMNDQVFNLKKRGISALAVHSGQKYHEVKRHLEIATKGDSHFLYVSPERLETSLFLEYLPYLKINLIAVDEAHCISQWGYDFRPAYLRIAALRKHLPDTSVVALTASATRRVQKDICDKLEFAKDHRVFTQTYDRKNLSYSVFTPPAKENKIAEIFQKVPGSGIAYCRSRKRTRELSQLLGQDRMTTDFYHAGLPAAERTKKQVNWIQNQTRVICCTNAFGMGIDKPDVRTVVHYDLPEALEYYYQEAGRAGRDGQKAYAVLLYHPGEIRELRERVALRFPDSKVIREIFSAICSFIQLPAGKGRGLSFEFDIGKFLTVYRFNPVLASSVVKILDQEEVFSFSDLTFPRSTVTFLTSRRSIDDFEKDFPVYTPVIKGLLRSYEGIFEQPCYIDEFDLARFVKMNKNDVMRQLNELAELQIIEYIAGSDIPKIVFYSDRVPADELVINEKNIALRKAAYEERLSAMIEYATQKEECRSIFINRYFGGEPVKPCGICDVCLSKKKTSLTSGEFRLIVRELADNHISTYDQISSDTGLDKNKVSEALYYLMTEDKIVISEEGQIIYKRS